MEFVRAWRLFLALALAWALALDWNLAYVVFALESFVLPLVYLVLVPRAGCGRNVAVRYVPGTSRVLTQESKRRLNKSEKKTAGYLSEEKEDSKSDPETERTGLARRGCEC